ncbi:fumarylacetoacetate hydrolase family protein [Haloarcula pellucida]|uniref:2-hydroxyhepta-2,4-diene-1,7-dioate isomerase n=1 Tax=Haloarcula pellucida TaxID=1427151 RepID=A0A830GHD2_9EURY|nr:fumarylacetoacetate hydrolase family protein [Halomicroarcula pellucida]MBX0347400.1 fumarylacetoacetate hydrolase family protein [Halomicroarcula pellucida]GGN88472.1 2-hydroxyhepta-2,4-diene-1,7-dioate isomerase [Halomicroarcula pellucida]
MQFVRYTVAGTGPEWGVRADERVYSLADWPGSDPTLADIGSAGYRRRVREALETGSLTAVDGDVSLLAPVEAPGKIVCAGLNYRDHAEEQDEEIPEKPLLFSKAATSVTNPGDPIVHPADLDDVDYEVELGVVIGQTASSLDPDEVRDHVAGYTVINDVSGRDAQFDDGQFFRGKSYDTFSPMGPTLVAGDGFDPNGVDVACRLNGETKQSSNTEQFIFDVDELVAYISDAMTLRPGDVISTGTPGGVGIFRDPPELMEPGDTVEVEIEGIGVLENPVVGE